MVDSVKTLVHAELDFPVSHISIKDTESCAMESAINGHLQRLPLTTEWTDWRFLCIWLEKDFVFDKVEKGLLVGDIPRGGWRYYGDLSFRELPHEWFEIRLPPRGVESWAERFKLHDVCVKLNGACSKCGTRGTMWIEWEKKKARWQRTEYCALCWDKIFLNTDPKQQKRGNTDTTMQGADPKQQKRGNTGTTMQG